MDFLDAIRSLNTGITIRRCPDCNTIMNHGYVRAPSQQDEWYGVPGFECAECGYVVVDENVE